MKLFVETPSIRSAEREYILDVVLYEFLGLDWQYAPANRSDIRITMEGHNGEVYMPDVLLSVSRDKWLTPESLPIQPLEVWDSCEIGVLTRLIDSKLPIIYGDLSFSKRFVSKIEKQILLPLDILGSAFFMLTRYEEIVKQDRDEHDRFPASASIAYQENFLLRPIVDEYVEVLWASLKRLWPELERRNSHYKVFLTHDVDQPFGVKGEPWNRVVRRFGGDLINRKNFNTALRRIGSVLLPGRIGEGLDPNNTFDLIMDQSEKCGLKSEFYFMAGKSSEYDNGYDIFSPRVQRLLRHIHDRGHSIGLHPSYGTLGKPDLLASEAENLSRAMDIAGVNQVLYNGRQHYLRWQAERTWSDWEKAGLKQDSSVGYAQHVGFRAGTGRCYRTWSWFDNRVLNLVEQPLIVMDGSLFSKDYMALNELSSFKILKNIFQSVYLLGGSVTLLWHNNSFIQPVEYQVYQQLISENFFGNE